jgi:uncharacterized membrane protein
MARYSVPERISKAITAVISLIIVLAVWYAIAPGGAVFDTPIGQLTINKLILPLVWVIILIQCVSAVCALLFEAIAGRDCIKLWGTERADDQDGRAPKGR